MIFDTHAHYDDEQFDTDRDELLSSMALQAASILEEESSSLSLTLILYLP